MNMLRCENVMKVFYVVMVMEITYVSQQYISEGFPGDMLYASEERLFEITLLPLRCL